MSTAVRRDAAERDGARRRIEELVCGLPDAGDQPFDEPWEVRAFAMAVAAHESGQYDWSEFQLSLVTSIRRWENGEVAQHWSYYEHWLVALESVLADKGTLPGSDLDERTKVVLAAPRNANHHEAHREPVAISPASTR